MKAGGHAVKIRVARRHARELALEIYKGVDALIAFVNNGAYLRQRVLVVVHGDIEYAALGIVEHSFDAL